MSSKGKIYCFDNFSFQHREKFRMGLKTFQYAQYQINSLFMILTSRIPAVVAVGYRNGAKFWSEEFLLWETSSKKILPCVLNVQSFMQLI